MLFEEQFQYPQVTQIYWTSDSFTRMKGLDITLDLFQIKINWLTISQHRDIQFFQS